MDSRASLFVQEIGLFNDVTLLIKSLELNFLLCAPLDLWVAAEYDIRDKTASRSTGHAVHLFMALPRRVQVTKMVTYFVEIK